MKGTFASGVQYQNGTATMRNNRQSIMLNRSTMRVRPSHTSGIFLFNGNGIIGNVAPGAGDDENSVKGEDEETILLQGENSSFP